MWRLAVPWAPRCQQGAARVWSELPARVFSWFQWGWHLGFLCFARGVTGDLQQRVCTAGADADGPAWMPVLGWGYHALQLLERQRGSCFGIREQGRLSPSYAPTGRVPCSDLYVYTAPSFAVCAYRAPSFAVCVYRAPSFAVFVYRAPCFTVCL